MITFTETITFVKANCPSCHVPFMITQPMYNKLQDSGDTFYCPSGHKMIYGSSTLEQKLKQAEQEKQSALNKANNLEMQKIQLESQLKKSTNKLKRVQKGVCPCCNRTFTDLQRHMESKHPDKTKK